ncbi:SDR family oxidoreductase [Rickettsiella endosymbiont of Aleochara curtula]|uniref:SDR family NAD(P)-dependent oxidoreductase n=1 Tax=Rickettsiella endosymbiont of Aleochara curtula TaxID=3077936 RepID=UPI00313AEBE6
MKLLNKKAIISGASKGLGSAIAQAYVEAGANVVICARDKIQLLKKQAELQSIAPVNTKVIAIPTDVASPEQVEYLIKTAEEELGGIDILVANAGIYGPKGPLETLDWQAWSDAIDINLKGTVLQCRAVIPFLKKQKKGKIIIISGGGATKPMPNFSAYAASKAGIVRFSETLANELQAFNIDVMAISPGALNTDFLNEVLCAGPENVGDKFYQISLEQAKSGGSSPELAADLSVYLASDIADGITGKLISAVWDPWSNLHEYYPEIAMTDIYTLRRIKPENCKKYEEDMS